MATMGNIANWIGLVKVKVDGMRAEIKRLEMVAASYRTDFERERERTDQLVGELLRMTATAMHAESARTELEGELVALQSRKWWQRLVR